MNENIATLYIEDIDDKLEINLATAKQIDSMTTEQISIYLHALNELIKEIKEEIEYVDMFQRNK